jgi:hypothetical protein
MSTPGGSFTLRGRATPPPVRENYVRPNGETPARTLRFRAQKLGLQDWALSAPYLNTHHLMPGLVLMVGRLSAYGQTDTDIEIGVDCVEGGKTVPLSNRLV